MESDETLAGTYCKPVDRYNLERRVEQMCNLPVGAISVHCPKRQTSMKVAEALVVGSELNNAAQLRDVTKVSPEGLEPYQAEIRAIEEMYRSIWQFHAFLDPAHWAKWPVVAWAFEILLTFNNDKLLAEELAKNGDGAYWLLATDLKSEVPPKSLPDIIERVDVEMAPRMRQAPDQVDPKDRLRAIIKEAIAGGGPPRSVQLGLPGVGGL
jgi:ribonucleotide reductase alpha subunit